MRFLGRRYSSVEIVPLRVTLLYVVIGAIWIAVSDRVLWWMGEVFPGVWGQTIKGLLFVAVTGAVLYSHSSRLMRELLKSHQRLATTLESIGDAVFATDCDGHVLFMNRVAERMTDVPLALAKDRLLSDIIRVVDSDGKDITPSAQQVSRDGTAIRFDGQIPRPSLQFSKRGTKYVSGVATPMFDPSGAAVGVVLIVRDVTARIRDNEALQQSTQELETIFDSVPVFIFYKDLNCRNIRVNKAFADAMGRPQEEWIGKTSHELFPDEAEDMIKDDLEVMNTGRPKLNVIREYKGLKGTRLVKVDKIPYKDVRGNVVGVLGVATDITDLESTREELSLREQEFRLLFATMTEAFVVLEYGHGNGDHSRECRLIQANRAFARLVGRDQEDLIGQRLRDIYPSMCNQWSSVGEQVMSTGKPARFEGYLPPTGKYVRGIVYRIGGNRIAVVIIDDTDRRQVEERVEYLSYHDKLTGVHNRAYLEDQIAEMDSHGNLPLSILIADVDGLKLINDTFGHAEGDKYLKSVAASLKECCGDKGIVARWGGDEFAIVMPNTPEPEASDVVSQFEGRFESERRHRFGDTLVVNPLPVGITIGHATKADASEDIMEIMKRAESEMYKRKFLRRTNIRNSMITSLREMLNARTHETHEHASRLAELALSIARSAGLSTRDQNELSLLAVLHDIGKIGIPDRILDKPGPLTDQEWEIMKTHCVIGYRIASSTPDLAPIASAILHHHERWDGKGYPEGLSGEDIPVICRIVSVVDAYDAMTNDRPYRKARAPKDALEEIRASAGTQFDPDIARLFLDLLAPRIAG